MITLDLHVIEDATTGKLVDRLCRKRTDQTGAEDALRKKMSEDRFKDLVGNKLARVRVDLGETIGGPGFSSVRLHVSAEITCNQDEASMKEARNLLYDEGLELMDTYIDPAYKGLLNHLKRIHGGSLPED